MSDETAPPEKVSVTWARCVDTDAAGVLEQAREAHGEPCEIVILCTPRGTGLEMSHRIQAALALKDDA